MCGSTTSLYRCLCRASNAHYAKSALRARTRYVLSVFVYLSLVYLTNLVLIALAKLLAYNNLTNTNSCVSVVERVQQYSKPLASLLP